MAIQSNSWTQERMVQERFRRRNGGIVYCISYVVWIMIAIALRNGIQSLRREWERKGGIPYRIITTLEKSSGEEMSLTVAMRLKMQMEMTMN